jgi:hypothetical protein
MTMGTGVQGSLDLRKLREMLTRAIVHGLKDNTRTTFPEIWERLGIVFVDDGDTATTKRQLMKAAFDTVPDHQVPELAHRYLGA